MKIITKKTIKKECYNLDIELITWINEHVKMFFETTRRDLDSGEFIVQNKVVKLRTAIKRLITITDKIKEDYLNMDNILEISELTTEMYKILEQIHWYLWW